MIVERAVLLRIEHFQQCRGRIAAKIRGHLVDFIEQEQRIANAALGQVLNDLAGHRSDVGAPMAADLRLVANAPQGHAHELAIRGARDTLSEGRLADAGRSHQAQDRAAKIFHALLHGQVLDDALFDLFQTIVIGLEHLLGGRDVQVHLAALLPRRLDQPIDVVAHHGGFRRHGRHQFQFGEF